MKETRVIMLWILGFAVALGGAVGVGFWYLGSKGHVFDNGRDLPANVVTRPR